MFFSPWLIAVCFFCIKEIDTQLQREQKLQFPEKQELQKLQANEKTVLVDITGCRVALSSLEKHISKLEQNALKKQEYINSQARHPVQKDYSYLTYQQHPRCCAQAPLIECSWCTLFSSPGVSDTHSGREDSSSERQREQR